jgi:hypothetical protein
MLARKLARSMRQQHAAVIIQTAWRRHQMRLQYQHMLHNIVAVQALWRGVRARMQYADLRQQHAATVLQSNWRRHTQQSAFQELRAAAVVLQGAYRWVGLLMVDDGGDCRGDCRGVCLCGNYAVYVQTPVCCWPTPAWCSRQTREDGPFCWWPAL